MTKAEAAASMGKDEAAQFLGVSVRTLQRHTAAGKVSAKYVPGGHGHEAVYDRAELERFKQELERVTSYVRPAVIAGTPDTPGGANPAGTTALAAIQPNYAEKLAAALEALKDALRPARTAVPLSDKLMLTLAEAAALSGLSRAILRSAIRTKKLKAQILGKGFKVKRTDLESYVQKL